VNYADPHRRILSDTLRSICFVRFWASGHGRKQPFETEGLPRGAFLYLEEGTGKVSRVGTPPNTTYCKLVM